MRDYKTNDSHVALLREAGLRSTPQRLAIVREVFSASHPTVGEVYDEVRRQFPTIGLATVYNTLRSLTELGYVRELPFGDATRFDVNVTPHTNLVCTNCGAIEDSSAANDLLDAMRSRIQQDTTFRPESQRVDIYGLCSRCAAASSS
jgi:Fur family peroxide stress response transcriptional regulator